MEVYLDTRNTENKAHRSCQHCLQHENEQHVFICQFTTNHDPSVTPRHILALLSYAHKSLEQVEFGQP